MLENDERRKREIVCLFFLDNYLEKIEKFCFVLFFIFEEA
jgi:hypothetical protein